MSNLMTWRMRSALVCALLSLSSPASAFPTRSDRTGNVQFQPRQQGASGLEAAVVCVAGMCVQGFSNISLGATISAPSAPTSLRLLPGLYTESTSPQLLHDILVSSQGSISPAPGFSDITDNTTSTSTSGAIQLPLSLDLQPGLAVFKGKWYSGETQFSAAATSPAAANASVGAGGTPLPGIGSLVVSRDTWTVLSVNAQRVVVWDAVPDLSELPLDGSSPRSSSLSLLDIQSTSCSPACSSSAICSPTTGTCICRTGFTGPACEQCAPGFFGPACAPCPAGCDKCDEGAQGSGKCLGATFKNQADADAQPAKCGCVNGRCTAGGNCACTLGWEDAADGNKCAKCASGFFQTSTGDCQVCQLGCAQCSDQSGECIACAAGFTTNALDRTRCDPPRTTTSTGEICPDGSFGASAGGAGGNGGAAGGRCQPCSGSCRTCVGPTSNECSSCKPGFSMLTVAAAAAGGATGTASARVGVCVQVGADGICQGSGGLVADNVKNECESCGAKCTSCQISGFTVASTIDEARCTACLPGFVLSNGKCVESCPTGTVLSEKDNLTCIPCSSQCGTCAGTPDFCLTCSSATQLAFNGQCVSAATGCPAGSFSPSSPSPSTSTSTSTPTSPQARICQPCHGDCTTCSGPGFDQCTSCPAGRPVLGGGRCLPTCPGRGQFFAPSSVPAAGNGNASSTGVTGECSNCDASCATCLGAGADRCMSCDEGRGLVLRRGRCVSASEVCPALPGDFSALLPSALSTAGVGTGTGSDSSSNSSTVAATGLATAGIVPGLGVCFTELVLIPSPSGGNNENLPPLPTISGLTDPTAQEEATGGIKLEWWQILLMALGCAFIVLVVLLLWRRKAIKDRMKRTKVFVEKKGLDRGVGSGWRWRLKQFFRRGDGASGGGWRRKGKARRGAENRRRSTEYSMGDLRRNASMRDVESGAAGAGDYYDEYEQSLRSRSRSSYYPPSALPSLNAGRTGRTRSDEDDEGRIAEQSLYSRVTGVPRRGPEPRQPVKDLGAKSIHSARGDIHDTAAHEQHEQEQRSTSPSRRKPVPPLLNSRFSMSTMGTTAFSSGFSDASRKSMRKSNKGAGTGGRRGVPEGNLISLGGASIPPQTEAQAYAMMVRPELTSPMAMGIRLPDSNATGYQLFAKAETEYNYTENVTAAPTATTTSGYTSKNPFRQQFL